MNTLGKVGANLLKKRAAAKLSKETIHLLKKRKEKKKTISTCN